MSKADKANQIKMKANEMKALYEQYVNFSKQTFEKVETEDGTILEIADGDSIATGTAIYKIDESGKQTLVDDGDYILKDGRTITVENQAGVSVITSIADGAGEEGPADENSDAKPTEEAPVGAAATDVNEPADVETRMTELEANMEKMMEMLSGLMSKQEAELEKMSIKMSKLIGGTEEEFKRTKQSDSVKEKLKIHESPIMTDLRDHMLMRDIKVSKKPVGTEKRFSQTQDSILEMRELISKSRTSGKGGSITIS